MKRVHYMLLWLFCILIPSATMFAGNINGDHSPHEYGKVDNTGAKNIPRPYYQGNVDARFLFSASYTLWVPYMEGLVIAKSNIVPTATANLQQGNVVRPNNFARSGLKVLAAKYLHYDDWKANCEYTWFNNPNNLSISNYNIENIYRSPWIDDTYIDLVDASSSFSNQFNRLSATLDRGIAFTSSFIFTPQIGIIGAWETSHLRADLQMQKEGDVIEILNMRNTMYWWCIGPYGTADITVRFGRYFSFFVKSGLAINLAKKDTSQRQQVADTDTPDDKSYVQKFDDHTWDVEPAFESSIGIKTDYEFKDYSLFLNIAWENQTWMSHNGFYPATNLNVLPGNYSMQGLTATIGIIL